MIRARAMTLIEIMVAVLIASMIMGFLLTIYSGAMRTRRAAEAAAELDAQAAAAFGLLRRDLTGAFSLAGKLPHMDEDEYPDVALFDENTSFIWEAPVDDGDPAKGFRRVCFVSAVDGGRMDGLGDPFYAYEHNIVTWAARGELFRRVGGFPPLDIEVDGMHQPHLETMSEAYADDVVTISDPGPFRGAAFIPMDAVDAAGTLSPSRAVTAELDSSAMGLVAYIAMDLGSEEDNLRQPPGWMDGYRDSGLSLSTSPNNRTLRVFYKAFPGGKFDLGPNEGRPGEAMYVVMVQPLWWSLGAEVTDFVMTPDPDVNMVDIEPGRLGSSVPKYVNVEIEFESPVAEGLKRRYFERVYIPAGRLP